MTRREILSAHDLYKTGLSLDEVHAAVALVAAAGAVVANSSVTLAPGAVFPPGMPPRASRIDLLPVTERNVLTLLFPLPPLRSADDLRVGALDVVASLVGDEGVGSALSYLRAAHLAEELKVDLESDTTGFALLKVEVTLSPAVVHAAVAAGQAGGDDGNARLAALHASCDLVSGAVFSAVRAAIADLEAATAFAAAAPLLAGGCPMPPPVARNASSSLTAPITAPVSRAAAPTYAANPITGALLSCPGNASAQRSFRMWRDVTLLAAAAFRFPDKPEAQKLSSSLAKAMQREGPDDILSPPWRRVWQPAAVLSVLRAMTPANTIFVLESRLVPPDLLPMTEPIYGSSYALSPLEPAVLDRLTSSPAAGLPPRLDGRPIIFATLSKASPAASSRVRPSNW